MVRVADELVRIVTDVRTSLEGDPAAPAITWGIHTHNDAELAVANSIAAVQADPVRLNSQLGHYTNFVNFFRYLIHFVAGIV